MPDPIQSILAQFEAEDPNMTMWFGRSPWLTAFAAECHRKIRWAITSAYSQHTHPALQDAHSRALAYQLVSNVIRDLYQDQHKA